MSFTFKFDPKGKGLRQVLGDLEADIMEHIWDMGEVTVRQVYSRLKEKREIAYTTVMTVMTRLAEKGILSKVETRSAHLYKAHLSKNEFTRSTVKQVMDRLLEDFSSPVINQFMEFLESENPEKIEELARIIEKKRKQKNV